MSKQGKNTSYAAMFIKDLIFIGPFFLLSFLALRQSVPSNVPFWILFWALVGAFVMSCVAWIALQMFKAVLVDQRERRRAQETVR